MTKLTDQQDAFGHAMYDAYMGTPAYNVVERDDGVVLVFYSQNYLKESGDWSPQERAALRLARGNVLVETVDSTKLQTDSLTWNNREQLVRTDAHVQIQTPKGKVEGIGLVSDAGLEKIEILSEVTGQSEYRFRPAGDSE